MTLRQILQGAVLAAVVGAAGTAWATLVTVDATAGPWDPTIAGNNPYGIGDQTAAAVVPVNAGDNITITWDSGLTSSFAGVPPTVDALGYTGSIFGSGQGGGCPVTGCTGIGSSSNYLPSFWIDQANTGPQIALNALIGVFVDSAGMVLEEFAPGNGPFPILAPAGAVALQLGINDDIFGLVIINAGTEDEEQLPDNTGALIIDVTGSTVTAAVPEPVTLALVGVGLAGLGFSRRRKQ